MSLSILLSSSSFFLADYLTDKLNNNNFSEQELSYALELKLDAANRVMLGRLELSGRSNEGAVDEHHNQLWLSYAKKVALNDGETSIKLARFYFNKMETNKSIYWYQQALGLQYYRAVFPLAKLYFENNQLELSRKTLVNNLALSSDVFLLAVEVAIAQGDTLFLQKYLPRLSNSEQGQIILAKIKQYQILADGEENVLTDESCRTSLQLFATSLADLDKTLQFKQQFSKHVLSDYICLAPPKYLPINKLTCEHKKGAAIKCLEGDWQTIAQNINTRYLGVLYPYGGANVHLGIMYFDRNDTFDVFTHEISHLLGFVDEYPLAKNHAKCRQVQNEMFAQNITVINKNYYGEKAKVRTEVLKTIPWASMIKPSTPILTSNTLNDKDLISTHGEYLLEQSTWLLGTPKDFENEVGVFNADTCQSIHYRAYKPLNKASQLQYYQLSLPKEYLKILTELGEQFYMPSFHYNVAMALLSNSELEQGKAWLIKAMKMEDINARKLKVLQGKF